MYREWKKIEFPKGYYVWNEFGNNKTDLDQEIDGKMKWGKIEEELVEEGGRKNCIAERNWRISWERQGIVAFCTCQWIKWMMVARYFVLRKQHYYMNEFIQCHCVSSDDSKWVTEWRYWRSAVQGRPWTLGTLLSVAWRGVCPGSACCYQTARRHISRHRYFNCALCENCRCW
jgi:hypothetical protein